MQTSRRQFLGSATAVGFSSLLDGRLCRALEHAEPRGPFKRCLVLWMEGGPSQIDTFDPKSVPGAPRSVATDVAGVRFAESLGRLAERAGELCVIRSVGSGEGEHLRATELMHTGFAPVPSFPRPALGSFISRHHADPGFPRYVTLGGSGFGPAFLGDQHGPFVIEQIEAARKQLHHVSQQGGGLQLLRELNRLFSEKTVSDVVRRRTATIESVMKLLETRFPESLDLSSASADELARYGENPFGQRMLTARRLLELGVPFVEAQLEGWDTHVDNQRRTSQLCRSLEQPWIALLDDLQRSGLWDDTLLVWMGEFGRTPRLNGGGGRDHYPQATPVVLGGGNLGGLVVGQTSDDGATRLGDQHTVGDLMATLMSLMGLDPETPLTTEFGSPTTATDEGTAIDAIISRAFA